MMKMKFLVVALLAGSVCEPLGNKLREM